MNYMESWCENQLADLFNLIDPNTISSFSLDNYGLVFLQNEIILNSRKNIIEFGSGLSTLCMALLIKKLSLKSKVISVEGDLGWYKKITQQVKTLGLDHISDIIYAPLTPYQSSLGTQNWYCTRTLKDNLMNKLFDLVVIDGPPAYHREISLSRHPAFPFIFDYLNENCTVMLDDMDRDGEKNVVASWHKQFGINFSLYSNKLGVYRRGAFINSHPSFLNRRIQ